MLLENFTGPGSTQPRRKLWDAIANLIESSQKIEGKNVSVNVQQGYGSIISVNPQRSGVVQANCPTALIHCTDEVTNTVDSGNCTDSCANAIAGLGPYTGVYDCSSFPHGSIDCLCASTSCIAKKSKYYFDLGMAVHTDTAVHWGVWFYQTPFVDPVLIEAICELVPNGQQTTAVYELLPPSYDGDCGEDLYGIASPSDPFALPFMTCPGTCE